MSSLSGHYSITLTALKELKNACLQHTVFDGLPERKLGDKFPSETALRLRGFGQRYEPVRHPALGVVLRDIEDFFNGGHWKDFAQKHHFMRRLHSPQTQREACDESVEWIRGNALESAKALNRRIVSKVNERGNAYGIEGMKRSFELHTDGEFCPLVPEPVELAYGNSGSSDLRRENLFLNEPAERLANALHALQDSFSPSHVRRGNDEPYRIEHILKYEGEEKEGHDEADQAWVDRSWELADGFTDLGRRAIDASKALISTVLNSALENLDREVESLAGWEEFKTKWLAVSATLQNDEQAETCWIPSH